jgi:hypothetical protein
MLCVKISNLSPPEGKRMQLVAEHTLGMILSLFNKYLLTNSLWTLEQGKQSMGMN